VARRWPDFVEVALTNFDDLAQRCDKVAVVGLSVGGGLTALIAEERPSVAGCVFINPMLKGPGAEMEQGLRDLIDSGLEILATDGKSDIKKEDTSEAKYEGWPLRALQSVIEGSKSSTPISPRSPRRVCCSRVERTTPSRPRTVTRSSRSLRVRRADLARGVVSHRDPGPRSRTRGTCDDRVPREGLGLMPSLRREDVAHVAKLARLTMSESELDKFTEQLGQVLDHASDMNALDLEGVVATAHPFGLINVVRGTSGGPVWITTW